MFRRIFAGIVSSKKDDKSITFGELKRKIKQEAKQEAKQEIEIKKRKEKEENEKIFTELENIILSNINTRTISLHLKKNALSKNSKTMIISLNKKFSEIIITKFIKYFNKKYKTKYKVNYCADTDFPYYTISEDKISICFNDNCVLN